MAESFTTTNRYFDNKHYPRGFSRHGDFTIKEAQLLERHGYAQAPKCVKSTNVGSAYRR